MTIVKNIIPIGVGIRTGTPLKKCLGLVIHWLGVCQSRAERVLGSFTGTILGTPYICDWNDGHIIQCAPEDERCNHVGATKYTALAKKLIGSNDLTGSNNPNLYFVGIECCIGDKTIPDDWATPGKHMGLGKPSDKQYAALVEFAADFLTRHRLTTENLYRHYDITGKLCHVWFVKDESRWEKFKANVRAKMKGEEDMDYETFKGLFDRAMAEHNQTINEAPVSPWAKESWGKATEQGIFDGTKPMAKLTREQAALVFERMGLLKGSV